MGLFADPAILIKTPVKRKVAHAVESGPFGSAGGCRRRPKQAGTLPFR